MTTYFLKYLSAYLFDEICDIEGGQRCLLCYFHHHTTSSGQSRTQLPGLHQQWKIPLWQVKHNYILMFKMNNCKTDCSGLENAVLEIIFFALFQVIYIQTLKKNGYDKQPWAMVQLTILCNKELKWEIHLARKRQFEICFLSVSWESKREKQL